MSSPANLSKRTTVGVGWGRGFLLVFFPQQHGPDSSRTFKPPAVNTLLKRSNSVNLLAKAQSTISVCALVIFFTLLLFTLSNFEPNNNITSGHYRRHLSQSRTDNNNIRSSSPALQRLGTTYSRGTKPMNDLVICHIAESATLPELKTFLRAFHRSGLFTKSDLLFIFPSITSSEFYGDIIREETRLFLKLIRRIKSELVNRSHVRDFPASFDVTQFVKSGTTSVKGESIWGRKIKSSDNNSNSSHGELTRLSYGSVVGFGVGELDPENALSGFLDHVPMGLRRWAAYPMLLGRLRRNFKHVTLADISDVLLAGDPLAGVRNCTPAMVFLSSRPPPPVKHNRKPTDKKFINPSLIAGGARGVRRLSAAMLMEIVRSTTHKKKIPATESALLSRLVANELVQKNIHFVTWAESTPEASSSMSSLHRVWMANKGVVRRGNSGDSNIDSELMKHICSFRIEASVYTDCRKVQPF